MNIESILNVHYRLPQELLLCGVLAESRFCGVSGGMVEWIFIRNGIISITVSAANRYINLSQKEVKRRLFLNQTGTTFPILEKILAKKRLGLIRDTLGFLQKSIFSYPFWTNPFS